MTNTFVYTVTIYNKYVDDSEAFPVERWKRTVLDNCYFGSVREEKQNNNSLVASNSFVCRIPKNKAYSDDFNGENDKFTLSPGDIIVKGNINDIIEDKSGRRTSDLINKYKGKIFTVDSVSDNTLLSYMPHYRAFGR